MPGLDPLSCLRLLFLAAMALVIYRTAWVCDDSYISFRVARNLCEGFGLRWNPSERVCAFTNPLMVLSMAGLYSWTGEFYYTAIGFSAALSLAAVALVLWRFADGILLVLLSGSVLVCAKAFVDYSTSGLESCQLFLLAAFFYRLALSSGRQGPGRVLALSLVASLLVLARLDAVFSCLPLLFLTWWEGRSWRRTACLALGLSPVVAWEAFSLVYYGRLFPNTAYAKLNTGLDLSYYLSRGWEYFHNSLLLDPLTLPVIGLGMMGALSSRRPRLVAAGLGPVLHLLYVLRIGGDFMSGRFFALPLFCSLCLLCRWGVPLPARWRRLTLVAGALLVLLVGLVHPLSPLRSTGEYDMTIRPSLQDYRLARGICDERAYYYPETGLLRRDRFPRMPAYRLFYRHHGLDKVIFPVMITCTIGFEGCFFHRQTHVVDYAGLADPLVSLLPVPLDEEPRIGHMLRYLPPDYIRSRLLGGNCFEDPGMGRLYDALLTITTGPLWTARRWECIWKLNTGHYDSLVDRELFQYPPGQDKLALRGELARYGFPPRGDLARGSSPGTSTGR